MKREVMFSLLAASACQPVADPFPGPDGSGTDGTVGSDSTATSGDGSSSGGDRSDTTDDGSTTGTGGSDDSDDGSIDYDQTVQPIWDLHCVRCHGSVRPNEALNLEAGPEALVDIPSVQVQGMPLVLAGDTTRSYLWHKLTGNHLAVGGRGTQMPEGEPPLVDEDMEAVQAWIDAGAPD